MGATLSNICQVFYAVSLGCNMLLATACMKMVGLLPMDKTMREGYCLLLVQAAWRVSLFFAPWISTSALADQSAAWNQVMDAMRKADAAAEAGETSYHPLFILGNHTSFLDTVLVVTKMPTAVQWRIRTYMDAHLFKLPILSTICRCVGHFPVYFKSDQEGVFKVDKEKNECVEKDVDAHLHSGGWLGFFPEGQLNKNPDTILPFRFGGMKKALDFDARLASFVTLGNPKVWPKKVKVGGYPGRVLYSVKVIAPDGAKAFVSEIRKRDVPEERDVPDHELLARHARDLMQAQYDELKGSDQSAAEDKKSD